MESMSETFETSGLSVFFLGGGWVASANGLACWFGAWIGLDMLGSPKMKGIVTYGYPDSNPKAPGTKPPIHH